MATRGLRRLWGSYEACLQARPAATKGAVSLTMFAITDVAVQHVEREVALRQHHPVDDDSSGDSCAPPGGAEEVEVVGVEVEVVEGLSLDLRRTATQAMFGGYYGLVHAHFIWGKLEQLFGAVRRAGVIVPGGALGGALARVALDQLVTGTPLFNTVFFYGTGRLSRGMGHDEALQHVRDRLLPMMQLHWCFWVPFHTLNFWLVPIRHRLLPTQAALLGWSSFMSFTGAKRDENSPEQTMRNLT